MEIFKKLIEVAIVGFAASHATKAITGKHIHEHVLEWWGRIREKVLQWAHAHGYLGIVQVIAWVDTNVAARISRITVTGQTRAGQVYAITEEVVSADEVARMFGDNTAIDITETLQQ